MDETKNPNFSILFVLLTKNKNIFIMAVPKKRTSRSRKKMRKSLWLNKTNEMALKALSLAKSILTNRSKSFHYGINNELSNNFFPKSDQK